MEREIKISIDPDTHTEIANITGNAELFQALGYLSQWNMNMQRVRIHAGIYDGVPEITATYWRHDTESEPIAYQIGAIWHDTHFGYHS